MKNIKKKLDRVIRSIGSTLGRLLGPRPALRPVPIPVTKPYRRKA